MTIDMIKSKEVILDNIKKDNNRILKILDF